MANPFSELPLTLSPEALRDMHEWEKQISKLHGDERKRAMAAFVTRYHTNAHVS